MGDAHANMADSYLVGRRKMGMDLRIASPRALWPRDEFVDLAREIADEHRRHDHHHRGRQERRRRVRTRSRPTCGSRWASRSEVWAERIELLKPYQVNAAVMAMSGNPDVKFMHCLPAFHNLDTSVGAEILARSGMEALEVTDEVFESPASIVFDEAENRMHTIKAVLVATLGA